MGASSGDVRAAHYEGRYRGLQEGVQSAGQNFMSQNLMAMSMPMMGMAAGMFGAAAGGLFNVMRGGFGMGGFGMGGFGMPRFGAGFY
ncbi:hypothetical protein [Mitsuaria sp. GD03876]|uniref:hypothetical protein n=1 Tax=Mitsuaria sp. GD03876 TaxID=2975399 RepID=UPI002449E8EF|nr:hypothetical protein [Mitsuaria sp. GD03876]MDH0865323.1 hypothetical protein [Mitsuaria sp. GD03876]